MTVGPQRVVRGKMASIKKCSIVAETEVKLATRISVSFEERINTVEKLTERLYHIMTERYKDGKEEVNLCSSVIDGRETVHLLLANTQVKLPLQGGMIKLLSQRKQHYNFILKLLLKKSIQVT